MDSCKRCRSILGSLVKKHGPDACPLANASYCGLCASYGHSPSVCPDTITRAYREPQFLEQLIPPSVLEEMNIRTQTALPSAARLSGPAAPLEEKIWEVLETDEGLRQALMNLGLKPMICQEKGRKEAKEIQENKRRLAVAADAAGYKVMYIRPARDEDVREPTKKTIVIKSKKTAAPK